MVRNIFYKIKNLVPKKIRLKLIRSIQYPKIGNVKSYDFFSIKPISSNWGGDRGTPVDRYYIEKFISKNSEVIKGRVLEIGDNYYTIKYGGSNVTLSDILHADNSNPKAAFVGDLTNIPQILNDTFDCIILTQTLQLIADLDSAVNTLFRILKKDGCLLVTVPGISKIYVDKENRWPDYWRFTENSMRLIFMKKFLPEKIIVESYGNVLSSVSFLHGMAMEELKKHDLDYKDDEYQMIVSLKAVK